MENVTRARRLTRVGVTALMVAALAACTSDEGTEAGPAAQGGKWCSDVKIAAFPGGGQGTPFTNNVHNGYKAAEADLGPSVTYYFSDWSEEKMVAQFREALALKPDGMAIMGHPGDDALDPLIDEAFGQGVQVTVVNVELPKAAEKWAASGLGYVGAPNYAAGKRLAEETVKRSGAKAGDKAFV